MDTNRWQVAQRKFLCTPTLWKLASECGDLCNEIGFGVLCRLLEDEHHEYNNLSKLNCWIVVMIRELMQVDSNWLFAGT